MEVKSALARLTDNERKSLMLAFQQQTTFIVKKEKFFVGVNVDSDDLVILDRQGDWCAGTY